MLAIKKVWRRGPSGVRHGRLGYRLAVK